MASVTVVGDSPALAANGDQHFVRISTHGAPEWSADTYLFNDKHVFQTKWHGPSGVDGHRTWSFYEQKGWTLDIVVYNNDGEVHITEVHITKKPLDRDYCFIVKAFDEIKYTGDSKTGHCTDK